MGDYTENQLDEYREMFELFDVTGSGKVKYNRIGDCFRAFGEDPTIAEVAQILGKPSKEDMSAKSLSFEEYMPMFDQVKKQAKPPAVEDFIEGLRIFDKESNGTVLGAELRHVLLSIGEKLDEEQVNALMTGHEEGEEGTVNYVKFSEYLMEA